MRWVFPGAHPFDLERSQPMMHLTQSIFRDIHFDRYRLFATDDLDEVRYRCAQVFNPHRLALQGPHQKVRSRMDHLSLGRMALSRLTWGASVQVDPGSLKNFYLLVLPVRGQAVFHFDGAQIDVSPRAAARDFVLLGHSYGGTIISKVVEDVAERVRRLVYWNAFVLKDGECLLDNVPYRSVFEELAKNSADNSVVLPFDVWRESFINDADLDLATSTYASLSSEPFQPFADKLDLSKFYTLTTPRSYINCTEDIALPHGEWAWHPRMASRLGLCRVVQIPGSHEVMFTAPQRLAQAFIDAGRD